MSYSKKEIVYFDKVGPINTNNTFRFAKERMKELSINKVLVASDYGNSAVLALDYFKPKELVVVAPMYGFGKPGATTFKEENRALLKEAGVSIIHNTHVFAGIDRAINQRYGGITHVQLVAQILKMQGEGFKVCLEIATMAADCGMVGVEDEVISIAGTLRGADTAIVVIPCHTNNFLETQIREIICIPRVRLSKPQPL